MPVIGSVPSPHPNAPHQPGQPSRKGKKAWRKNVDVEDIVKGLQHLNDEIIQGGVIKERESKDLFVIDLVGNQAPGRKKPTALKSDEIIAHRSGVPTVATRKRPGDRTTDGVLPEKRIRSNWVSHRELARLRMVADGHHDTTIEVIDATYDVWTEKSAPALPDTPGAFDPALTKVNVPETMKRPPVSLSANGKPVPAVPKPSGGYSYNPSYLDYEQRFAEEGRKAVEAEKARLNAEDIARSTQAAVDRSAADADVAEAKAELSEWDDESAWEGFESSREDARGKKKPPKRKDRAQRNRIWRHELEERRLRLAAAAKARESQATRIKQISREVTELERARALALIQDTDSETEGNDIDLRRKRLGKCRIAEKDLELVLPHELEESLRLLKPEGNLLKERFRSYLVRGKMETRKHLPFKKQAKASVAEKWSYRHFNLW